MLLLELLPPGKALRATSLNGFVIFRDILKYFRGLAQQNRGYHGFFSLSERDVPYNFNERAINEKARDTY